MAMTKETERELLQIALGFAAAVPFLAGIRGVLVATPPDVARVYVDLDSHYVYLSGLLMGMGIAFWYCIRHIERKVEIMRILCAIVFIGGVCRLTSWVMVGRPSIFMMLGLGMELVVTPLFAFWTVRIGKRFGTWKKTK